MVKYNEKILVQFIKDNKQLILDRNFDLLYSMIDGDLIKANQLTQFLIDCGINPLDKVTKVVNDMFLKVTLPDNFKDLTVPYSAYIIFDFCFAGCNIRSIDLRNVKDIASMAFASCTGLTSIDLKNVESIGGYALYGCTGLKTVYAQKDLDLSEVVLPMNCKIIRK